MADVLLKLSSLIGTTTGSSMRPMNAGRKRCSEEEVFECIADGWKWDARVDAIEENDGAPFYIE